MLIEEGKVLKHALARELLTNAELMTVLHRQGFDDISEVRRCVLEPGGTFDIQRETPDTDTLQHMEVMTQLKELSGKIDALLQRQGA